MVLLVAAIVAGVWYVVFDMFLIGPVLGSFLAQIPGINPTPPMMWVVIGDFMAALVQAGVYMRTRSVFGVGARNGAVYGVYAGVLVNFPIWLFMSVYVAWPYGAAWALTVAGIVITTVGGALMGLVIEKMGAAKAA